MFTSTEFKLFYKMITMFNELQIILIVYEKFSNSILI